MNKKKKEREKEVRKKILRRRTAIRAQAKKDHEEGLEKIALRKATNKIEGKTVVIRKKEEIMSQLEHNLAILEALENEKKAAEQARDVQEEKHTSMKASADVVFTPKTEDKE